MNYFNVSEKILKHNLKKKRSITLSLIVSFLITGGLGFVGEEKIYARDLRSRTKTNEVNPEPGGAIMSKSANGTDVVNIVNPNSGGISHNKFIDLSVGTDGIIFNNNSTGDPYVSKIGGIVTQNPNLNKSANTILSEVTGNKISSINGVVEVAGQRADFILANENGISLNGAGFINTNGVTLTTGRPIVSGGNIDLDVQKGNISVEGLGVGTAGDYFNIIAKTIELTGQIAPFDGERDADITLVAGQNKVSLANKSKPSVTSIQGHDKNGKKYGIYANHLGSMYGKNIKLISTTEGLGVRHEGIIKSSGDINIDVNGDISIGGLLSEKSIGIKGKGNLNTTNGTYLNSGITSNFSVTAGDGIDIDVLGDIVVESVIQAEKAGIKIVGRNLTMKAKTTAKILSQTALTIKIAGNLNIEELLVPVLPGRDPSLPPLVITVENGRVVVRDPITGREIQSNELTWETTGIIADQMQIEAGNLVNEGLIQTGTKKSENTIDLKVTNQLTNKKIIASSGNLKIDANRVINEKSAVIRSGIMEVSANSINNAGELRQNVGSLGETAQRAGEMKIDIKNGTFENTGVISGYNVKIVGTGFVLNNENGQIVASTQDYPSGLGTITIDVKTLENKGVIQSYGKGIQNNITINTETLINHFGGKITAQRGSLSITTTVGDLLNSGEFFADKNITLKAKKDIKSSGKIGGDNITITAEGNLENYGKIVAVKELMVNVNNLINAGTPEEISKYLEAFNKYVEENHDKVLEIIKNLEDRIAKETNPEIISGLTEALGYYRELDGVLRTLKYEIDKVGSLGVMSGQNITLSTKGDLENNGIVKATENIGIKSNKNIINKGVLEAGKDITLNATGDIRNTQRIYAKENLTVTGKNFISTGNDKLMEDYAKLVSQFNEKALKEAEDKIKELETLLENETDPKKIIQLKAELKKFRDIKNTQSSLKAKIITVIGLGVIEAENISITTTENIENSGIMVTDKELNLKAGKDIINNGNISVGTNANLQGKDFKNKDMSVGEAFNGQFTGDVSSETLKVQKDIKISGKNIDITKDLSTGGKLDVSITSNGTGLSVKKDAKVNVKTDVNIIGGGLNNDGELLTGGDLNIDAKGNLQGEVKNTGSVDIGGSVNIDTNLFNNDGSFKSNKNLKVNTNGGNFKNSGDLQSGEGAHITGDGFVNTGSGIFGGNLVVDTKTGGISNKDLEVTGDISFSTTGGVSNTGTLQNTGKLVVNGKSVTNKGKILNTGTSITASGNVTNENSIESTGDISIVGGGNVTNKGEIKGTKNGKIVANGDLVNDGTIAMSKNLDIKGKNIANNSTGKITAGENLNADYVNDFSNSGAIAAKNIKITHDPTAERNGKGTFKNGGKINAAESLGITSKGDITIKGGGDLTSNDEMKITTSGNINIDGRFQNKGSINLNAGKDITNKGMVVSAGDISLKAENFINEIATSIWAGRDMVIDVINKIHNKLMATIESKGNMTLTAKHIVNDAGTIKAGGDLKINTDKLENRSIVEGTGFKVTDVISIMEEYKYGWIGVDSYAMVFLELPIYEADFVVKEKATIQSGGSITIKGKSSEKTDIHNYSGTISAKNNISITGEVTNETASAQMSAEEYLKNIKVVMRWENRVVGGSHVLAGGNLDGGTGTLFEVLSKIMTHEGGRYFKAFKMIANKNPQLKALISSMYGPDWMSKETISTPPVNPDAKFQMFAANGAAQILAGGNFTQKDGKLENIGGEAGGNKKVDVEIGDHTVEGVLSDLGVTVSDPNDIKEFGGVKQVHDVEIIKGQVTINGVTITATSGGAVTVIAIAGTINPVIYIEIPVGTNGIFRPAIAKPGEKVPYKFETNIDFIDVSKYYGSNYFFEQAGYDPNKTSTVIGDAYYESELINKTIREGLGYSGEVGTDQIKAMLDNAISVKDELGLELGKPLTPEQVNNLEKDIIWYVEMEVDGDIVLVPQVYFGKETRLKMAQGDQGGGDGSTIKAGGNVTIDADSVKNVNGTITGGGNVIIDSKGDIENSSTSGVNGGISGGSNVIIKSEGNIDMKGGTITGGGEIDINAKGDINVESSVGVDKDGNQSITNPGGIIGGKDVKLESGGDTTIKGSIVGSLDGNVNISGENVKIEDVNITESNFEQVSNGNTTTETTTSSSKSNGSAVIGNDVKINAKNDVDIKGSEVVANGQLGIEAGNDVNITDGQDYSHVEKSGTTSGVGSDGLLQIGTESSQKTTSKSKGSTVGGVGGADIKAGNDVTIKGSDVIGGEGGVNIEAGNDVNIVDGQDTESFSSNSAQFTGVGVTVKEEKGKSTTSKGSGVTTTGDLNIKAGGNVKVTGSDLTSIGDTNVKATGDVKFEAGKNESEYYSKEVNIGITKAGASAGAGGAGVSADWSASEGASTDIKSGDFVGVSKENQNMKSGKNGKMYGDSLAKVSTEVGVSVSEKKEKSTTWTESDIVAGGDLNIKSGGTTDIGGADFTTGGDFNIKAKDIETTKYEDVVEKEESNISVGVKVESVVTSGLNDAANQAGQIAETALDSEKELNAGLTAGQVAGAASSVIFGDLINTSATVTGEIGVSKSKSKTTEENITEIKSGGNIKFETTEGDINLKGVKIDTEKEVTLDSAGDINIENAKKTEQSSSNSTNISGGIIASTGVSIIDGGYAQGGVVGNVSHENSTKDNEYSVGSSISGGNINIKSKGDTNVVGSKVEGDNVKVDVGGDLKVETVTDKINEKKTQGQAGFDVQVGAATNTVGTGDIGLSAGGGTHWKEGEKIGDGQAGIVAKDKFEGNVGGDANIIGGAIGSETGEGSLNVGGDLNVKDVDANYKEGGEIINVSGGTKGGSIQGDIADKIEKDETAKGTIGLGSENITVGGDVTVNGEKGSVDDINNDLDESKVTNKDIHQGGGTFGVTGSVISKKKGSETESGSFTPDGGNTPVKGGDTTVDTPSRPTTPDGGDGVDGPTPPAREPIPDLVLPDPEPPVKLPVPEFKDPAPEAIPPTREPIPDLVLPDPEPPVKLPVPEFKDPAPEAIPPAREPIPDLVLPDPEPPVRLPVPEFENPVPEQAPNMDLKPEAGKPENDKANSQNTSGDDGKKPGYTGKHWDVSVGGGAQLTGGAIQTTEALKGLQKTAKEIKEYREKIKNEEVNLNEQHGDGAIDSSQPGGLDYGDYAKPNRPGSISGGAYEKDENGKWVPKKK